MSGTYERKEKFEMKLPGLFLFFLLLSFPPAVFGQSEESPKRGKPDPVLVFIGTENVTINGKEVTRYRFTVENRTDFARDLFSEAPSLPPCGTNTRASRTWVDLYEQSGKRLNGFCAIYSPEGLAGIWFAKDIGEVPPSYIYIELTDRQTNTKYRSLLAETVQ